MQVQGRLLTYRPQRRRHRCPGCGAPAVYWSGRRWKAGRDHPLCTKCCTRAEQEAVPAIAEVLRRPLAASGAGA